MKAIKRLAAAAGAELVAETLEPGMSFEDLACEVCQKLRGGTSEVMAAGTMAADALVELTDAGNDVITQGALIHEMKDRISDLEAELIRLMRLKLREHDVQMFDELRSRIEQLNAVKGFNHA